MTFHKHTSKKIDILNIDIIFLYSHTFLSVHIKLYISTYIKFTQGAHSQMLIWFYLFTYDFIDMCINF